MESNSPAISKSNPSKLIPILLIGFMLLMCLSIFCLLTFGIVFLNIAQSSTSIENQIPDAKIELTVDKDGCGVIRGDVLGDDRVASLTWVIEDMDGYSVLERNAENEYKYRYFVSGTYTVYINAWFDGAYHQISNEVEIS